MALGLTKTGVKASNVPVLGNRESSPSHYSVCLQRSRRFLKTGSNVALSKRLKSRNDEDKKPAVLSLETLGNCKGLPPRVFH